MFWRLPVLRLRCMCGIVGYVGSQSALDVVMAGLKRLEYRGYDSAGVAVLADGGLAAAKKAGKLVNLEKELVERPLPTGLTGIGHTRKQESDRVRTVAAAINALGGRAMPFADAIRVEPAPLHGGVVDAAGDHRIAMAFSVLGLQVPGVAIKGASAVTKTFPDFYAMLAELSR